MSGAAVGPLARALLALAVVGCGAPDSPVEAASGAHSRIDDVDGDGRDDCWERASDGGSGFGGPRVALRFGCEGETQVVDASGSFGEFLSAARLPAAVVARPGAVDGVRVRLFGEMKAVCEDERCAEPEGSFSWLLDELAARGLPTVARVPFARVWRYSPRWEPGAPSLPPSQVIALSRRGLAAGVRTLDPGDSPPIEGGSEPYALVAYHAHNHVTGDRGLARATTCGAWRAWTTAHGVAIEDTAAGRWSWVYVSTGVDKLRWPSLERVACDGAWVVIERRGVDRARELIVVAPTTGGVGTLALAGAMAWELGEGRLRIGEDDVSDASLAEALVRAGEP